MPEVHFESGGVLSMPKAAWIGAGEFILSFQRLAELGRPLNMPPDPCPFPRIRLWGRR